MKNFLTRNFSNICEYYVLFESSAFAIKELYHMTNKNHRTGINNQKKPWKGVLNIVVIVLNSVQKKVVG